MNKVNKNSMIVGNWKMHNGIGASIELITKINQLLVEAGSCAELNESAEIVDVVVAPPFTALTKVAEFLRAQNSAIQSSAIQNSAIKIKVAAQDLFWEDSGAYTGAVSAMMIKDAGADYVIIGHSERRLYFYETDNTVNQKIKAALRNQLLPIVCVGETLAEHDAGTNKVEEIIARQVIAALSEFNQQEIAQLAQITIAYEPVWAIGTGKTATPQYAETVHAFVRKILAQNFGLDTANKMRILYGGSVKADNSKELLAQPNINGALVGGASLKAAEFVGIIKNAG